MFVKISPPLELCTLLENCEISPKAVLESISNFSLSFEVLDVEMSNFDLFCTAVCCVSVEIKVKNLAGNQVASYLSSLTVLVSFSPKYLLRMSDSFTLILHHLV